MHISEAEQNVPHILLLTKCVTMSSGTAPPDDSVNRLGLSTLSNGTTANNSFQCEVTPTKEAISRPQGGGRLKFFKDGKFILELERSREGERVSWVSVPRKTFWPPQGTAVSTPNYRQESTSLSVSDDNSSIQSSPWQRDHSWKQSTPCRYLSRELCFFMFWRSKLVVPLPVLHDKQNNWRRRCRSIGPGVVQQANTNTSSSSPAGATNVVVDNSTSPATPITNGHEPPKYCKLPSTPTTALPKHFLLKWTNHKAALDDARRKLEALKRRRPRRSLSVIVQTLTDKIVSPASSTTATVLSSTPAVLTRPEAVVSPRKRFLREMEREQRSGTTSMTMASVPLAPDTNGNQMKRIRQRNSTSTPITTTGATKVFTSHADDSPHTSPCSVIPIVCSSINTNTTTLPRNCSYSITSLLANDKTGGGSHASVTVTATVTPTKYSATHSKPCVSTFRASGVATPSNCLTGAEGHGSRHSHHLPPPPSPHTVTSFGHGSLPMVTSAPHSHNASAYVHQRLPDERWYSESVDRLRSIELSHAEKRGYAHAFASHAAYLSPPPSHYMYSYDLPQYYGSTTANLLHGAGGSGGGGSGGGGGGSPFLMPSSVLYGSGGSGAMVHPPGLSGGASQHQVQRDSERRAPWPADLSARTRTSSSTLEDSVTDMPLNLSKNAG